MLHVTFVRAVSLYKYRTSQLQYGKGLGKLILFVGRRALLTRFMGRRAGPNRGRAYTPPPPLPPPQFRLRGNIDMSPELNNSMAEEN